MNGRLVIIYYFRQEGERPWKRGGREGGEESREGGGGVSRGKGRKGGRREGRERPKQTLYVLLKVNCSIGQKALHKTMSCVILALNWISGILPIQKSLAIRKYWKRGSNSS